MNNNIGLDILGSNLVIRGRMKTVKFPISKLSELGPSVRTHLVELDHTDEQYVITLAFSPSSDPETVRVAVLVQGEDEEFINGIWSIVRWEESLTIPTSWTWDYLLELSSRTIPTAPDSK